MRSSMLTRIIVLIVAALLVVTVAVGFSLLKQWMNKDAQAVSAPQDDTEETAVGLRMGPFSLRTSYYKSGTQSYVSFSVYYLHNDAEELWYTCGRMFHTAEVASIDWADSQYNIRVRMKNGTEEIFSYDGNNQWL